MHGYAGLKLVGSAEEQSWEARLAAATERDMARGMFFQGVLESMRGVLGDLAVERCRAITGERRFIGFFNYPVASFLKLSYVAAKALAPTCGGFDAALRRIGAQSTRDFLASAVGRSFLLLAGGDPRRLIGNLPSGYKVSVTYGDRFVDWQEDGAARFVMLRDFMPAPYHEGVLREVLKAVGAEDACVQGRPTGLLDVEYELLWMDRDRRGRGQEEKRLGHVPVEVPPPSPPSAAAQRG